MSGDISALSCVFFKYFNYICICQHCPILFVTGQFSFGRKKNTYSLIFWVHTFKDISITIKLVTMLMGTNLILEGYYDFFLIRQKHDVNIVPLAVNRKGVKIQ